MDRLAMLPLLVVVGIPVGVTAGHNGLTLQRFNNTALVGAPIEKTTLAKLDGINLCPVEGSTSPHSVLITGRLVPATAGRYGFQLDFTPKLPYPSPDAYSRFWVDDHLLYPGNTTLVGWGPVTTSPQPLSLFVNSRTLVRCTDPFAGGSAHPIGVLSVR